MSTRSTERMPTRMDYTRPDHLARGNDRQRRVYNMLTAHNILETLSQYTPVIAGTFPIDIDIEGSDVDILCFVPDLQRTVFMDVVTAAFGGYADFRLVRSAIPGPLVCNFTAEGIPVEIFAEDRPVTEQNGYRHMLIEAELLRGHGPQLREQVIDLKRSGVKTEPAFASILKLDGDPYLAVLALWPLLFGEQGPEGAGKQSLSCP